MKHKDAYPVHLNGMKYRLDPIWAKNYTKALNDQSEKLEKLFGPDWCHKYLEAKKFLDKFKEVLKP